MSFLTWLKETCYTIYLIFRLALTLNKHGLKMPVLANTLFGPQFSISQHFDFLSNVTADLFFCMTHTVCVDIFKMVACFYTVVEQCSPINNLSIASALKLPNSGVCNLKLCVTLGQWCSRDRNLRDRDLAQISRRDRDFVIKAQTETWKFETETRDLTFLWW